jgi:hypothetical protein
MLSSSLVMTHRLVKALLTHRTCSALLLVLPLACLHLLPPQRQQCPLHRLAHLLVCLRSSVSN